MNPVVVHVVRPYGSEQEYLAAEAWTIDARGMLLVEAEPLPPDTAVLFDVSLRDGSKPIRAEGRVVGAVTSKDGRPGGLRVRFKRFGAATKAFIERAVKAKTQSGEVERPSQSEAERPSQPEAERPSQPEHISLFDIERPSSPMVPSSRTALEAPRPPPPPPSETSQTRQPGPVAAPVNREELLARLRQRRQTA